MDIPPMTAEFTAASFMLSWLFDAVLIVGTYNPTQYCYFSWVTSNSAHFGPGMALAGVALLIGWIIYLRTTLESAPDDPRHVQRCERDSTSSYSRDEPVHQRKPGAGDQQGRSQTARQR